MDNLVKGDDSWIRPEIVTKSSQKQPKAYTGNTVREWENKFAESDKIAILRENQFKSFKEGLIVRVDSIKDI